MSEDHQKERLDIFINKICEFIPSRSFASKLINSNKVTVDKKIEKPSYKLNFSQEIEIDISFIHEINAEPVGEKIPIEILYEDEHLIVLNKKAGMVVHPGAGVHSGTLVNAILAHCGSTLPSLGPSQRAGIVHRLDRDTSGVMVVAKSQIALTNLSKQFAEHSQLRIYNALVYGVPEKRESEISTWHGRDSKNRIKYAVQQEGIGKKAILNYSVKECFNDNLFSLVECKLFTGRTHQIRVQLESIRHSIVGDPIYGQVSAAVKNKKNILAYILKNVDRQLLHATTLGFNHPATKEDMIFHSKLPQDFINMIEFLRNKNEI